jgi:hypothetical protein
MSPVPVCGTAGQAADDGSAWILRIEMRKQKVGRKCVRVGQQQMQVPAVVEAIAPEQPTAGRAEKFNVERLRRLRQHSKPHHDGWLTL